MRYAWSIFALIVLLAIILICLLVSNRVKQGGEKLTSSDLSPDMNSVSAVKPQNNKENMQNSIKDHHQVEVKTDSKSSTSNVIITKANTIKKNP